jgi:hypothetical protein
LGHIEGLSDLPDPLIDRHIWTIPAFFIHSKVFFSYESS